VKKRFAALLVVPALVLGASLLAVDTASATTAGAGGGAVCRSPKPADGLEVSTCATWTDARTAYGNVKTSGSNNTLINLCVELVDANQNLVPGSRDCQIQPGSVGAVSTPTMSLAPGTYYSVSYFTSPTYWYGGESPGFIIY
jgi:hypothetical protein